MLQPVIGHLCKIASTLTSIFEGSSFVMAMKAKEHTNLLSIFAFVFAGIQGLMLLFFFLYLVLMFGMMVLTAMNARTNDASGVAVFAIVFLLIGALAAIGITTVTLNIKMGKRLRSNTPPSQRSMIVASIFNICSFLCGGIFVLPFGTALGIYGLWFAMSEVGKRYFAGLPDEPALLQPPMPQTYEAFRQQEPYKWR